MCFNLCSFFCYLATVIMAFVCFFHFFSDVVYGFVRYLWTTMVELFRSWNIFGVIFALGIFFFVVGVVLLLFFKRLYKLDKTSCFDEQHKVGVGESKNNTYCIHDGNSTYNRKAELILSIWQKKHSKLMLFGVWGILFIDFSFICLSFLFYNWLSLNSKALNNSYNTCDSLRTYIPIAISFLTVSVTWIIFITQLVNQKSERLLQSEQKEREEFFDKQNSFKISVLELFKGLDSFVLYNITSGNYHLIKAQLNCNSITINNDGAIENSRFVLQFSLPGFRFSLNSKSLKIKSFSILNSLGETIYQCENSDTIVYYEYNNGFLFYISKHSEEQSKVFLEQIYAFLTFNKSDDFVVKLTISSLDDQLMCDFTFKAFISSNINAQNIPGIYNFKITQNYFTVSSLSACYVLKKHKKTE